MRFKAKYKINSYQNNVAKQQYQGCMKQIDFVHSLKLFFLFYMCFSCFISCPKLVNRVNNSELVPSMMKSLGKYVIRSNISSFVETKDLIQNKSSKQGFDRNLFCFKISVTSISL